MKKELSPMFSIFMTAWGVFGIASVGVVVAHGISLYREGTFGRTLDFGTLSHMAMIACCLVCLVALFYGCFKRQATILYAASTIPWIAGILLFYAIAIVKLQR